MPLTYDAYHYSFMWKMLRVRNTLAHDYDGQIALRYFSTITGDYFNLMESMIMDIKKYYPESNES